MDGFSQNSSEPPPGPGCALSPAGIASDTSLEPATESFEEIVTFVLEIFEQEIERQQLYYHGLDHVYGVARRGQLIFDTAVRFYTKKERPVISWDRQRCLLYLSAIAHDMLQIFLPQASPHMPRQRQSGHSEKATFERLRGLIDQVNQSAVQYRSAKSAFTDADVAVLQEAIEATVCQYDPADGSIYQPLLYPEHRQGRSLSLVAHSIALADIGTLGIEGIDAYRKEGSLLLLEENLDIVAFLQAPASFDANFRENLRQRLLQRARFEISFARGRLNRLDRELQGLPRGAIDTLKAQVFTHLTSKTIKTLERRVPTEEKTSLDELLGYFRLKDVDLKNRRLKDVDSEDINLKAS
ncbi:MAG: hypothetical protein AAGJ95_06425 [Cyanobacteria bacterium J06554_11]